MSEEKKTCLGSIRCPYCDESITLTKIVRIIEPSSKAVKEEKIVADKNLQTTLKEVLP